MSYLIKSACIVLIYFLIGKWGLTFALVNTSTSPFWPPSGFAISTLLLFGLHFWPSIFIGSFLVNYTTSFHFASSFLIAFGNLSEAYFGSFLTLRYAGGLQAFHDPKGIFRFSFLAGAISTACSATIGVFSLLIFNLIEGKDFGATWITWWLGNGAGVLVFVPFFVLWFQNCRIQGTFAQILELLFLLTGSVIMSGTVFLNLFLGTDKSYPLAFLLFPFMIWASFRSSNREVATMSVLIALISVYGTSHGLGAFSVGDPNLSLLILQAFLIVLATSMLAMSALVISQHKSEQILREQARVLERSNADLQQFAYAASHDLKEPLRMVSIYTQLLQKKYKNQIDIDADNYIKFIIDGTTRMNLMLEDLLKYTRIAHDDSPPALELDANAVFQKALSNLEAAIVESSAEVTSDILPSKLILHEVHLLILFQNIISNAIKYRSDNVPKIHVSATSKNNSHTFAVSDNGIGISDDYKETIFGLFKRLHGSKYPGTGIGLTLCQKIVERYNGSIWFESTIGKGSIFYFTLTL